MRTVLLLAVFCGSVGTTTAAEPKVPKPGAVLIDEDRGEVILSATVQIPEGKECIGTYGQRIQAFVGCSKAAGGDAKMAGYFVFLVDVPTEEVHAAMTKLGCKPRVHYSMADGRKRGGWKSTTTPDDFLQGDPVAVSVFWQKGEKTGGGSGEPLPGSPAKWVEKPYQDFVTERVMVDGKPVEKPWTPHFVYHGSGAIHKSGTGCIACPCDCAGGLIADNRNPLYDPKPLVKFDTDKVPKAGTQVYIRLRPSLTKE